MSTPYPGDLAVAFRSFARRLHEALGNEDHTHLVLAHPHAAELDELLKRVAGELHVEPSNDLGATGTAIAEKIEATRPKDWKKDQLKQLEADALEAGRLLRLLSEGK